MNNKLAVWKMQTWIFKLIGGEIGNPRLVSFLEKLWVLDDEIVILVDRFGKTLKNAKKGAEGES